MGQVPLVPQEMRWLHSYETVQFTNGDLGLDEYAVADAQGWYIRTQPADQAGVDYTTKRSDINGKTEVQIVCEKCAYYSVFENSEGQKVRVSEDATKYKNLGRVENASRPSKTEAVTLGVARRASAAIALDGIPSDENAEAAASSITWDHTVVSNTNGLLAVGTHAFDATDLDRPVTGVTFNSDPLTVRKTQDDATNNITSEVWTINPPDQVTGAVQITYSNTVTDTMGGAVSLTGVDQSTPTGATGGDNDVNTDNPSTPINTNEDNSWLIGVTTATQNTTEPDVDAPSTKQWGFASGRAYAGGTQVTTSAGAYTFDFTHPGATGTADWAAAVVEIVEAVTAPAATGGADEGIIFFMED